MSESTAITTSPSDYVILNSYTKNNVTTTGNFPIFIYSISECCNDDQGNQVIVPVVLPK